MRPRRILGRCVRLVAFFTAGVILQATGSCDQTLSNIVSTLSQDILKGAGDAVTNLAQGAVLNLFISAGT